MPKSSSRAPRIAIVLDHPQRDMAGVVLLAHALCQRGATCHIVPLNLQEEEVWSLAPDLVLLNYVRRGNDGFAARLLEAGIGFGVLDTEGGVWDTPNTYSDMFWNDGRLLRGVQEACMWGPRLAEHVVDRGLFTPDQVVVTGCPRFDLYAPNWQPIVVDDDQQERGYVLINTNFSTANPRFTSIERNVVQLRDELGWSHHRVMDQIASEQACISETIRMAQSLSRDFPTKTIVLRPHPFEEANTYAAPLASCTNVRVDGFGPVQPRIFRAAVVIQRGCSTAIEAAMASVPALSPRWFTIASLAAMTEEVSDRCDTYADLREKVASIFDGTYAPPAELSSAIARVIRDWFCAADGMAHARVADAVMERLSDDRMVDRRRCSRFLYGIRDRELRKLPREAGRFLRRSLRLSPEWSFRHMRPIRKIWFEQSNKYFSADHVATLAQRVRRAATTMDYTPERVAVRWARGSQDMHKGYYGFSVTISRV